MEYKFDTCQQLLSTNRVKLVIYKYIMCLKTLLNIGPNYIPINFKIVIILNVDKLFNFHLHKM